MKDEFDQNDSLDPELAQALKSLPPLQVPSHLHEKLLQIPEHYPQQEEAREKPSHDANKNPRKPMLRRVIGFGVAAAAMTLFYFNVPFQSHSPYSEAEIAQARQDLALTFQYLNSVSALTAHEVNGRIVDTSTHSIYQGVFHPVLNEHSQP